jgi:hypothetical protein
MKKAGIKKKLNVPVVDNSEGGVLAKLWQNILIDTGFFQNREYLINSYAKRNIKTSVKSAKTQAVSSIKANAYATSMSWKTFISLIKNLLIGIVKVEISVKLYKKNGDFTVHHTVIDPLQDEEELDNGKS